VWGVRVVETTTVDGELSTSLHAGSALTGDLLQAARMRKNNSDTRVGWSFPDSVPSGALSGHFDTTNQRW